MILVTTFYNNEISDKLKDATDALVNNLRNKYITKIVVLTDGLNNRFLQHNKITIVKVSVDFDNIIEWISKTYKSGEYVVSKPFVKYDISLSKIRNINLTDKLIVIPSIGNPGSTDSFIFNLPIDFSKYEIFKDKGIEVSSKYPYYSSNYKNLNKLVIENKQEQPIQQVTIQPHVLQNRKLVREELVPNVRRVNKRFAQPPVVIKREKSNQSTPEGYHRNHKIDIIIVSVNYNDFLAITLKQNKKFGRVTVATTSDDLMCHQICQKYGVNYIISDRVYENGAKFNKGKIINDVINSLDSPEWILHLDADIILPDNFLEVVNSITLDSNTLYGTKRAICRDYETYKLYKSGVLNYNQIGNIEQASGFGFYQMFNINNDRLGRPIYPEMSGDASWSDLVFRDKFTKRSTIELDIIHLGDAYQNWTGRRTERFISDVVMNDLVYKKSSYKIVTTYYNYRDDVRVKNNFIKFMQQFSGYDMIVGYIDDGNIDFEIPFKTVVIKSNEKKWWKEILLNKILDNVEDDYFIWIDNDLIYEDLSWLNNLDEIMNGKDFLQLFSKINYLGESGEILESYNSIMSANPTKDNIDNLLGGGYKPGGSWCGRTSILKEKKFYDGMVVGGGDTIFLYGLFGITNGWTLGKVKENNFSIYNGCVDWIKRMGNYKIGFLDKVINHLYHGDLKDRNYENRYVKLKTRGVMFISFGIDYERISPNCATTIRKFSNIPILVHTNVPDFIRSKEWENISNVEFVYHNMNDDENRIIKTQLSKYTKFDQTLYIDVDSSVISEEFLSPFEYLSDYDIVSPQWKTYTIEQLYKLSETSNKFKKFLYISKKFNIEKETFIAGGICYFNNNENTRKFFNDFHNYWRETGMKEDMPGLNGALIENRSIVMIIGNDKYNNYNSTVIVSHHNTLMDYNHMANFTRKRYNPINDRWEFCDQGSTDMYVKPKILFVYDVIGWAFYIISHNVKSHLYKKYDIDIMKFDDNNIDCEKYDIIICFSPNVKPITLNMKTNVICGVSSHKSNNKIDELSIEYNFVFTNDLSIYNEIKSENKYYIPNHISTEFFKLDTKSLSKTFRIGSIGSKKWDKHKGRYRINEICKILGPGYENRSIYIDTLYDSILSQTEIRNYYKDIDVVVISSESETGPNILLESMSCGIPVVSNKVGLSNIIIKDNINGFLIDDYNNIYEYVDKIRKLNNDNQLYNYISKNSKNDISEWDWSNGSKLFQNMIDDFLNKK